MHRGLPAGKLGAAVETLRFLLSVVSVSCAWALARARDQLAWATMGPASGGVRTSPPSFRTESTLEAVARATAERRMISLVDENLSPERELTGIYLVVNLSGNLVSTSYRLAHSLALCTSAIGGEKPIWRMRKSQCHMQEVQ